MAEIEPNNFLRSGSDSYARIIVRSLHLQLPLGFDKSNGNLNFSVAKMAIKTLNLLRGFGVQGRRQQKATVGGNYSDMISMCQRHCVLI